MRRLYGPTALLLALSSCAVGPDFHRPPPPAVQAYLPPAAQPPAGAGLRLDARAQIAFDWWTLFRSRPMDAAIREAIAQSPQVQAAQARLRQAQDELRAGRGIFFPAIGAEFDATRQKFAPARLGQRGAPSVFNLFTLSGTISYALDLFGGNRRSVEALKAAASQQQYVEQGTYLTLTSTIATAIIARAGYHDQITATQQIIAVEREQVTIARVRSEAGTGTASAEMALLSQLSSTEADLARLTRQLGQTDDLLARLVGRLPASWSAPEIGLADITLPDSLPLRLPAELARQRPDILAAEAAAHGASARIGVATAAMLPNVTLSADYGTQSNSAGQLLQSGTGVWGLGAAVAGPLFQGGSLWFRRKAAVDAYDAAMADYRQVVLDAFAQVADVLRALQHDRQALEAQSRAADASGEALKLVHANYVAGLAGQTEVLIADLQYQRDRIAAIQARAAILQDAVALFAALGGGWWEAGPDDQ